MAALPAASGAMQTPIWLTAAMKDSATHQILLSLSDPVALPRIKPLSQDGDKKYSLMMVSSRFVGLSKPERRKLLLGRMRELFSREKRKVMAKTIEWDLLTPQQYDWLYNGKYQSPPVLPQ